MPTPKGCSDLKIEWTRFTKFFASKRAAKFAVFFLTFGTTLLLPLDNAGAVQVQGVQVVCATQSGEQRTFTIGWDNAQTFFQGRGQISRLFCEGGYAGAYQVFVSTSITNPSLDYFNGVAPTPEPTPTPTPEPSPTPTVEPTPEPSPTPTAEPSPEPTPTPTPEPSSNESVTVVQETPTAIVSDSPTVVSESVTAIVTPTPQPEPAPEPAPQPAPVVQPPVVVEPQPAPAPQPAPEPTPAPIVIPDPAPIVQPEPPIVEPEPPAIEPEPPLVEPEPPVIEPEPPIVEPEPPVAEPEPPIVEPQPPIVEPEPTPEPTPVIEPTLTPEPASFEQPVAIGSVDISTLAPDTPVELENGVVLTAEVVVALALLENPVELLGAIFSDPGQALMALGNIGADMSPEVREQSEKVVISAIIAGGIATQAASIASASTYRRSP